ncbi:MAG: hypothetical protein UV73_C0005G0086 [Candidatus Gottesmanbacteria bacterium GW2011_GWA2_43_14]|uniref:Glycosyltransferase RgtA/B/C/D-like domain-containing protein n=1 Tax=Candidatus Gottesmanbacteria bacterium GW2011_GWA2_43_14 TaxID=1618443 RepID=A0A0G1DJG8_9BACT|nr:MAG: hypothetical protein UV73_C0005G0086 [Candidatus Gottesmanbacteria bacterium GW2011_GWA2_43_14]
MKRILFFLPLIIFISVLAVYFFTNQDTANLFRHFVFMADAFLHGRFDIANPTYDLGDRVIVNNRIYFQFGPAPAIILLPLVYIWKTNVSQTYVSMLFGALNSVLVYILLGRLKIPGLAKKLLLTVFFAFGTVHFSSAVTGTTWFFAHIIAVFFLLLALIENFGKKRPFLMGLFFSMAVFSRQPTFLCLPFFLLFLKKEAPYRLFFRKFLLFFLGALPLFLFAAFYNFDRFGNIFEDGRNYVYREYVSSSAPYTFMRQDNPNFVTGMVDWRNIPLNLYTLFLMPPVTTPRFPYIAPSPYGLSVILTSPFFVYALWAKRNFLTKVSWLAVVLIAFFDFLWFGQGWVQFGYRYVLDFIPFLMIPLAFGFRDISKLKIFLLFWSVIINTWGAYYLRV